MKKDSSTILGIDWGSKKIGLAIANSRIKVAAPIKTISRIPWKQAMSTLIHIRDTKNIEMVVIGTPTRKNSKIASAIDLLRTSVFFNIPIYSQDETMSSKSAQEISAFCKCNQATDDHFAAAKILQDYLDECL